jgi:hypothetical protein
MLEPQSSPIASTLEPNLIASPAEALAPADSVALAWLCFVVLLGLALVAIPLAAAIVRRGLPDALRQSVVLEPVRFGDSPRVQRSPRQPVRMHRTLLATALLALPALILLLGVGVLRHEGVAAVERALALVLPVLLVTLHARRRSASP